LDQVQILLTLEAAMLDRRKQFGVVGGKAGQQLSVIAVVLRLDAGDSRDLAGVGYDHLVAELFEQSADPGRVRGALQRNAHTRLALEMPPESAFGALDPPSPTTSHSPFNRQ